nr:MAG TPA: hypothetical protein [Caudoviricetes sp.]
MAEVDADRLTDLSLKHGSQPVLFFFFLTKLSRERQ